LVTGRLTELIYVILITATLFYYTSRVRSGWRPTLRRITALDAVDEAIGRCTETGRPVFFTPGGGDVTDASTSQTMAGLAMLSYVAQKSAEYDVPVHVGVRQANVYVLAQDIVRQAYVTAGKLDAFRGDRIHFLSPEQFAYAAGCSGIIHREKAGAVFLVGMFQAESVYLAEAAASANAISVAGTTRTLQIPLFVAACDYTLLGEEIFVVSAYLTKEVTSLGLVSAGDAAKFVAAALIAAGALLISLGSPVVVKLLSY
jgi:hypothetical protein